MSTVMSALAESPGLAGPAVVGTTTNVADPAVSAQSEDATRTVRALPVLAPLLPALLLIGLGVAGLSDPPAPPADGSGEVVSRLHVPAEPPLRQPPGR